MQKIMYKKTLLACLLALLTGWTLRPQGSTGAAPVSEVYQLMGELAADYGSLQRFYIIEGSPERRERFKQFYLDYKGRLEAMPFNQLSVNGRVDYLLTMRDIEQGLRKLEEEKEEYRQMENWISYGDPIYGSEKQRRRRKHLDAPKVASQVNDISKKLPALTEALDKENPSFPQHLADRAQQVVLGHRKALESVHGFYSAYDPDFSWWMERPQIKISEQLTAYAKLLAEKVDPNTLSKDDGSGIVGSPIGAKELKFLLEEAFIPYSAEDLVDIANKEFAWCEAELLKASQEMGFGTNWKAAQEKVKQTYVEAGFQP